MRERDLLCCEEQQEADSSLRCLENHPLLVILRSEATKNLLLKMKKSRFLALLGMTGREDFHVLVGGPKAAQKRVSRTETGLLPREVC